MIKTNGHLILQGVTTDTLLHLIDQIVSKRISEVKKESSYLDLNENVPAKQTAKLLGYKTRQSLKQYHGRGLTPNRVGKYLFYKRAEVIALHKKRFNFQ